MPEVGGNSVFRSCVLILNGAWFVQVSKHFSSSMGEDDFIARLEIALFAYGFTGDNSIGTNECSDSLHWSYCAALPSAENFIQIEL